MTNMIYLQQDAVKARTEKIVNKFAACIVQGKTIPVISRMEHASMAVLLATGDTTVKNVNSIGPTIVRTGSKLKTIIICPSTGHSIPKKTQFI